MSDYPTTPTRKGMTMLTSMSAHQLYRLLCDGLTAATMSRIDRAINVCAGATDDKEHFELLGFYPAGRAALDDTQRDEMDVSDYAADNDITEDEARRKLEEKAYWS